MRLLCRVPSLSTPGTSYAIRMFDDGPGCECPAFDYSQEPKTCKHLEIYQAAQHATKRCAELGHHAVSPTSPMDASTIGALCRQCVVLLLAAAATKVKRQYVPAEKLGEVKAKASAKVADIRERAKQKRRRKR